MQKRRGTRGRRVGLGRSHSQLVIAKDVSESFRRALRKGLEERDAKKKQGVLSPTKIEEKKQIMSKLAGGQIFDHNQFQRSLSSRTAFGAPYDHNSSILERGCRGVARRAQDGQHSQAEHAGLEEKRWRQREKRQKRRTHIGEVVAAEERGRAHYAPGCRH